MALVDHRPNYFGNQLRLIERNPMGAAGGDKMTAA
jgi:hypothetical protein